MKTAWWPKPSVTNQTSRGAIQGNTMAKMLTEGIQNLICCMLLSSILLEVHLIQLNTSALRFHYKHTFSMYTILSNNYPGSY
jgi:hypothetical protein